jgi:hypothetical protein
MVEEVTMLAGTANDCGSRNVQDLSLLRYITYPAEDQSCVSILRHDDPRIAMSLHSELVRAVRDSEVSQHQRYAFLGWLATLRSELDRLLASRRIIAPDNGQPNP